LSVKPDETSSLLIKVELAKQEVSIVLSVAVIICPIPTKPDVGLNVTFEIVGELASTPGRFDGSAVV